MSGSLSAVLFDIDGTLVDSNYAHIAAWSRALSEVGKPCDSWRIHGAIGMDSAKLLAALLGPQAGELGERAKRLHSEYFLQSAESLRALPGATDLLRALAARGLRLVLATSASKEELDVLLSVLPGTDVVEAITSAQDVENAKPAPEIVQVAMDRVKVSPSKAIMIGDAVWDIEAARRAGIDCVAFLSGGTGGRELADAGAIAVYDDPADLLANLAASPLAS